MPNVSSIEEARALVRGIAASNGDIDDEHWAALGAWDMNRKRIFQEAFLTKDNLIGASVITLAKNLYSSNAHFLFELIQNCEDNHYEKATRRGETPFVLFEFHRNHIIVECNEDGFTDINLAAICKIGKSSKNGMQAYVGEKGIGFKSVFKVAYKAVIQSGYFSFSFTHHKGESGMGMISPHWEDNVSPIDTGKTRITLWLHEGEEIEDVQASIKKQIKDVHEEMLLFLRKIQKIEFKEYFKGDDLERSTVHSRQNGDGDLVQIQTRSQDGVKTSKTTKHFLLSRYLAAGLPRSESREYTEEALASKSYEMSEIILAFPLTENSVPLIAEQQLFSFLPVSRTRFKFIIQADFVTEANREGIETSSSRNRAIREQIPEAYIRAITQMCKHANLQYQWMRYLPSVEDGNAWGDFWSVMIRTIKNYLPLVSVLRPASLGPLRWIQGVKRHTLLECDQDGHPLFADIPPEIYLSTEYADKDLDILKEYGLEDCTMNEILARVSHDLHSASSSRMKSYTSEEWHSRAAKLLQLPFQRDWDDLIQELKDFELLPLATGDWTSINDGTTYYPYIDNLEIPLGLELRIIDKSAAKNPDRKKLFDLLGVQTAPIDLVREQIIRQYSHRFIRRRRLEEVLGVAIMTTNKKAAFPKWEDVYIRSDDELSTSNLLAPTPPGPDLDDGAPGFPALFINDFYLQYPPLEPSGLPTWMEWLHVTMNIRRDIRFKSKYFNQISDVCRYVAKHRPRKFMSLLNKLWQQENEVLSRNTILVDQVRQTKVLCRGDRFHELRKALLPSRYNEDLAARFLHREDPFRWLQLDASSSKFQEQEWRQIATDLKFGLPKNDLEFGLGILAYMSEMNGDGIIASTRDEDYSLRYSAQGSDGHRRVYDLYVFLEAQIRGSENAHAAQKRVQ